KALIAAGSANAGAASATERAPRTLRSAAILSSFARSRAISTKSAPSTAQIRQHCSAIPDVAPTTTILMAILSAAHQTARHARAHARIAMRREGREVGSGGLEQRAGHAG